jgi:hypothetical protein
MPRAVIIIYGLLGAAWFIVAPIACIYGLTKTPTPQTVRRTRGIATLGFLLSGLLAFWLATTTLQPLALVVLFAAIIFVVGIFRPSTLELKGVRIYLILCMAGGELFWMWAYWDQFVRRSS